jgi:hypothetical protein
MLHYNSYELITNTIIQFFGKFISYFLNLLIKLSLFYYYILRYLYKYFKISFILLFFFFFDHIWFTFLFCSITLLQLSIPFFIKHYITENLGNSLFVNSYFSIKLVILALIFFSNNLTDALYIYFLIIIPFFLKEIFNFFG